MSELGKEGVHLPGEFEKQVKKLCLDPKAEKELIDMLNKTTGERPVYLMRIQRRLQELQMAKKWRNINDCNVLAHKPNLVILKIYA